jgi:putative transposase
LTVAAVGLGLSDYLSGLHVKVRDTGAVRVKAVYLAIGINMSGEKEVLGLWIAQTEGVKFWLQVVTELKSRSVQDIFIACVDGLKEFPEAIETVYPHMAAQLEPNHSVFRLPARDSADHLHHSMPLSR